MTNRLHSILFVDDDPFVLRGIRRSVEEYSDLWRAEFVQSGSDALEILAQQPFDAVVTDMHMPGMDGFQLLEAVSQKMPGVMRFVLSGNTSDAQIMKLTHLAHQMIPKPCDVERLFSIVERACRLRDMLTDPQLLRLITAIKTLPSVPVLYNNLIDELQSENANTQTVGNIIAQDAAMSAKILQLVNSAFFTLADNVSSPQRAVAILGLNTVKALVLGIQVFSEYQGRMDLPISVDALWKHSMLVSSLADGIAKSLKLSAQEQESSRASGILHDIGKLILLQFPGFFQRAQLNQYRVIPIETEYQLLGTSHAEMGAYLLGMWGLPNSIVEAVTFHHRPGEQITERPDLVTALHVANGLATMCSVGKNDNYTPYLDLGYLERLGLVSRLDEWTSMSWEVIQSAGG